MKNIMTLAEVAERLRVSPSMARRWAILGQLPHFRIGRLFRFDEADVDAWIEKSIATGEKAE